MYKEIKASFIDVRICISYDYKEEVMKASVWTDKKIWFSGMVYLFLVLGVKLLTPVINIDPKVLNNVLWLGYSMVILLLINIGTSNKSEKLNHSIFIIIFALATYLINNC